MKIILLAGAGLASFLLALTAALALSGNLNRDAMQKLMGAQTPTENQAGADQHQDVDTLVRLLREKETALERRERELNERETQLLAREESLQRMRAEVETMQGRIQDAFADEAKERETRLETVAVTLTQMRPNRAAERLEGMPPEDIADILKLLEPRDRGKIIEALEPELATRVLRRIQEGRL